MDTENAIKVKFSVRKEKINDDDMNNYYKKDKAFQENVMRKKQVKRRKEKLKVQEIEDSLKKKQLKQVSINVSADMITPKKESTNENEEIPKKPSKRQLKREKVIQAAIQKKESSRINAMQKALNYVSMWKHSRSEWKFEKLKQIWLIDNLLDENSIRDEIFPLVLEYFEGCKGMAREVLLRKGMDIIRKAEEKKDDQEEIKNEITESIAYKRARQLLQTLPTDK
ncbi:cholesin [Polyergus mexicanus]|uniref:cholesin n=1 Tax=Polyergus mexicanus TaxID=615972 RepID=UPI0038B588B7